MKMRFHSILLATTLLALTGVLGMTSCSDDIESSKIKSLDVRDVATSKLHETFYNEWFKMDTVSISLANGQSLSVYTPWSKTGAISSLPVDIARNVLPKDGWAVAFCTLGESKLPEANYFGLYNKYLGILRIFYYITDASGSGSEVMFGVTFGDLKGNNKKSFYSLLPYGTPLNHNNVVPNIPVAGGASTFYTYATPYSISGSTTLTKGWGAFDIDMSSYTPDDALFTKDDNNCINIMCKTQSLQNVTLSGTLTANISGSYSSATPTAASNSGLSATLASLGAAAGDITNSSLASIEQALTGSSLSKYCYYAGSALNMASKFLDFINDNPYKEQALDSMPGKIDMKLTGAIDLNGYITSTVQNQVPPLNLWPSAIEQDGSKMGSGVWALEEDPVICLVDDHLLGDQRRINLTIDKDSTYGQAIGQDDAMRIVSFLDPTSIKLSINTDNKIFDQIDSVEVKAYCGVYTHEPYGHTFAYRQMMGLENPKITLVDHSTANEGDILRFPSDDTKMKYHQVEAKEFLNPNIDTDESIISVVSEDSVHRFYGSDINMGGSNGKPFMVDPQVYVPINLTTGTVYDAQIPDYVVCLYVNFKANGEHYTFSRRYLPKYQIIKGSEVNDKLNALKDYSSKCEKGEPVSVLSNDNSIKVTHSKGHEMTAKTIKMLETILAD